MDEIESSYLSELLEKREKEIIKTLSEEKNLEKALKKLIGYKEDTDKSTD